MNVVLVAVYFCMENNLLSYKNLVFTKMTSLPDQICNISLSGLKGREIIFLIPVRGIVWVQWVLKVLSPSFDKSIVLAFIISLRKFYKFQKFPIFYLSDFKKKKSFPSI